MPQKLGDFSSLLRVDIYGDSNKGYLGHGIVNRIDTMEDLDWLTLEPYLRHASKSKFAHYGMKCKLVIVFENTHEFHGYVMKKSEKDDGLYVFETTCGKYKIHFFSTKHFMKNRNGEI